MALSVVDNITLITCEVKDLQGNVIVRAMLIINSNYGQKILKDAEVIFLKEMRGIPNTSANIVDRREDARPGDGNFVLSVEIADYQGNVSIITKQSVENAKDNVRNNVAQILPNIL
ncbi:MAG: hypothetical protein OXI66_13025 [Boseongicola sp.]|nr:hypothetical protein [Boseongicola sp.]